MNENALAVYEDRAQLADASPLSSRELIHYAEESAPATLPAIVAEDYRNSPAKVDWAMAELEADWGAEGVRALRGRWSPSLLAENLQFATAFAVTHADVYAVFQEYGYQNHPATVIAAAMLGRLYAERAGDPTEIRKEGPTMPNDELPPHLAQGAEAQKYRDLAEAAYQKGDRLSANYYSDLERQAYARANGGAQIVGRNGRTV